MTITQPDTYGFGTHRALGPNGVSLVGGAPGAAQYPTAELAEAFGAVFDNPAKLTPNLNYSLPEGLASLRTEIAALDHGADPARIVVTNGGLHALSLAFATLIEPGDTVLVEDPSYPLALRVLQNHGPRFEAVARTTEGIDVAELRGRLERGLRPKLFYSIPDFHNPTGASLPAEQRVELVRLAEEFGFVIVSDNPYTWLRLHGEEVADYDPSSSAVVHANTFAKTLGPGLRLGWAVVPEWLRPRVLAIRSSQDQHPSAPLQAAVAHLLAVPGGFAGILDRVRADYRAQSTALSDVLTDEIPGLTLSGGDGGIFLWAQLENTSIDLAAVRAEAQDAGTDFVPGRHFRVFDRTEDRGAFRVGFSHLQPAELEVGAHRLAAVLNRVGA